VSAPSVAVLGLGEAGSRLAADLVAAGADVHGFDPFVSSGPDGVVLEGAPEAAVAAADLVLSVATGAAAGSALEGALPALRSETIYADLNTASPELKRELAARVPRFVDVALLGAVPARGLGTPALASGTAAEEFAAIVAPLGMPVEVVSGRAGDAAALKLVRSVFMKGLAAAAIESLAAAEAAGHRDWLERQLGEVIGAGLLERLVEGSRRHATRRVDEMDAACELLVSLGIEPRIAGAARAILAELGNVGVLE
jgi:3-hydroxyisobutyrate dehydrogenase-like beta-hydroxyacid dehydrogenase